jgi:hypothetical protein
MTSHQVFTYWPSSIARSFKRWYLRRKLAHIGYTLAHIAQQDEDNRHAKRILQGQMALIQSDIRNI